MVIVYVTAYLLEESVVTWQTNSEFWSILKLNAVIFMYYV